MKALSPTQVDTLIHHLATGRRPAGHHHPHPVRQRNTLLARLMFDAGLRVSEACAIRDEHVRWDAGQYGWLDVDGGKGRQKGQVESVPISEALAEAIRAAQASRPSQHTPILVWGQRGQLTRSGAWRVIQQAGLDLGIHLHPHMLRHTTATTMLERGVHIRVIQRMLRHRRLDTTMRYMAVRDPMLDAAVDALR